MNDKNKNNAGFRWLVATIREGNSSFASSAARIVKTPCKLLVWLVVLFGLLFSGGYLAVNIVSLDGLWSDIKYTRSDAPVADNDSSDDHTFKTIALDIPEARSNAPNIFGRTIGFFRHISIDLSAITPLLLFWFFCSIIWFHLKHVVLVDEDVTATYLSDEYETAPFPTSHERIWIQLGFIGTLWGFLLIGWKMSTVSIGDQRAIIDILLKAFGTALLSTFTAVVLVYVAAPIFRGVWRWAYNVEEEDVNTQEVTKQVDAFSGAIVFSTESICGLNKKVMTLNQRLNSLEGKLAEPAFSAVIVQILKSSLSDLREAILKLEESVQGNTEKVGDVIAEVSSTNDYYSFMSECLHAMASTAQDYVGHSKKKSDSIEDMLKDMHAELSHINETIKSRDQSLCSKVLELITNQIKAASKLLQDTVQQSIKKSDDMQKSLSEMSEEITRLDRVVRSHVQRSKLPEKTGVISQLLDFFKKSLSKKP